MLLINKNIHRINIYRLTFWMCTFKLLRKKHSALVSIILSDVHIARPGLEMTHFMSRVSVTSSNPRASLQWNTCWPTSMHHAPVRRPSNCTGDNYFSFTELFGIFLLFYLYAVNSVALLGNAWEQSCKHKTVELLCSHSISCVMQSSEGLHGNLWSAGQLQQYLSCSYTVLPIIS